MPDNFSVSYYLLRSTMSHIRCQIAGSLEWDWSYQASKAQESLSTNLEGEQKKLKGIDQRLFSMSFSLAKVPVEDEAVQESSTWQQDFFFFFFASVRKNSVRHVFK